MSKKLEKSELYSPVFNNLIDICNETDISIYELLDEFNFKRSVIKHWKKGKINSDEILKIVNKFNISIDFLFGKNKNFLEITKTEAVININQKCPFCNAKNPGVIGDTFIKIETSPRYVTVIDSYSYYFPKKDFRNSHTVLEVIYLICPYCGKTSYFIYDKNNNRYINIHPLLSAKQFTGDVPKDIYRDYCEAKVILVASPRASAALSRRCLQAMIHNRWQIDLGNLCKEISKIPSDKITQLERDALNAIRQIGNIGVHPDKIVDVEAEDAELLVSVIEFFLQKWYVDDPSQEKLLKDAIEINKSKKN